MSVHLISRTLCRHICMRRIPTYQAAASEPTTLLFYNASHNISTLCALNTRTREDIFHAKGSGQTKRNDYRRGMSLFSAGASNKRASRNKGEDPLLLKERFTQTIDLPSEPLSVDGWSKLEENCSHVKNFEVCAINEMIKMGTDIKIAKSLLSFVAEKNGDVSYVILLRYLALCVHQNQLAEVCDLHDIMKMKFKSFDSGANSLFIRGLSKTARWREAIEILEAMKKTESVTGRNYSDCVKAAIEHEDVALSWALYEEAVQKNLTLPEYAHQSLFEASLDLQDDLYRKRLISILDHFRENQIYPGEALIQSIKAWFERIPHESWRGTFTRIHDSGHCRACRQETESIHLTPEEYSILKEAVIDGIIKGEDTFRKTTPQELKQFLNFINSRPPYDIVVDGLNVAHLSPNVILSQALLEVVSWLREKNKRILVLGRRHMLSPSGRWRRQDIQHLQKVADCFFLDNISLDDPYLLYACLNSGSHCCFLTKDLLRDHKACLPSTEIKHLFFKWQRGHQLVLPTFKSGNLRLQPVLNHDTIVQSTDNSYHIPYDKADVVRASYEVPRTWLCLKKEQQ